MKTIKIFIISTLFWVSFSVQAQLDDGSVAKDAAEIVQAFDSLITDVVTLMSMDDGVNTQSIKEQVVNKTVNWVDFNRMTALAAGIDWKKASPEQKIKLSREFKYKLISTYYVALAQVTDVKVAIKPNPLIKNGGRELVIQSEVISSGMKANNPIAVDYFLYKTKQGYKIYNVSVQGISLVTAYRGQFSEIIKEKGLDGLINVLSEQNNNFSSENYPVDGLYAQMMASIDPIEQERCFYYQLITQMVLVSTTLNSDCWFYKITQSEYDH